MTTPETSLVAYEYKAFHLHNERRHQGVLYAQTERDARLSLREQELIPTRIQRVRQHHSTLASFLLWQQSSKTWHQAQWQWVQAMHLLALENTPFVKALEQTILTTTHPQWHVHLTQLKQSLLQGHSISQHYNQLSQSISSSELPVQPIQSMLEYADQSGQLMQAFLPLSQWKTSTQTLPTLSISLKGLLAILILTSWQWFSLLTVPAQQQQQPLLQFFLSLLPVVLAIILITNIPVAKRLWQQCIFNISQHIVVLRQMDQQKSCHSLFLLILTGLRAEMSLITSAQFAQSSLANTSPYYFKNDIQTFIEQLQSGKSLSLSLQSLACLPTSVQLECTLRPTIPSDEWISFFERHIQHLETSMQQRHQLMIKSLWLWGALLLLGAFCQF